MTDFFFISIFQVSLCLSTICSIHSHFVVIAWGSKPGLALVDRKKAIFLWFLFYTTRKLCVKLTFLSRWNSAVGGILQVLKFQCCHSHHLRHVSVPLGALPVPFLAFRTNVKISGGRPCSYCTYYCHCLYFGYLLIEVERFYCVQLLHNGLEDLEAGIFN